MKSNAQLLADMYANQGGREQLLVAVYEDAVVLYANVTEATASRISAELGRSCRSFPLVGSARSRDGMTYCWIRGMEGLEMPSTEPPGLVLIPVSAALRLACPDLLPADGTVMYVDNRQLDANTLDAFCSYLRSQPAA